MTEPPALPDQSATESPPDSPLSEDSKQKIVRWATTAGVLAAGVAVLVTGIAIGSAFRKRVYKWSRGS
ncbi:MAG TPA: hypothetical protein VGF32_15850 [Streptosporangiaceae bacterium]|jgi:hypothetical protein